MRNRRAFITLLAGGGDVIAPTVATFTATTPTSDLNIPITAFTASEVGASFLITESASVPLPGAAGWAGTAPTTYTVATVGQKTLYPWVKDAAGNVSSVYGSPLSVLVFVASISPTIGNTITVDGDMEAVGVTSWAAVGTPTTREKSGTQTHGGAQSLHLVTDATGEGGQQTLSGQTANQWFNISAWGYVASGDLVMTGGFGFVVAKALSAAAWTQLFGSDLLTGASPRMIFRSNAQAASEFYIDDVYQKPLTLTTCIKTPITGGATDTVSAKVTGSTMHKLGVIANLDSASTPLNYVLAVVDKDSAKAWLYQVSNGVYTAKINGTAITYVDDKLLEIRHTAETTYQLWYNGAQIGTDQTISDAAINANTLYAQFSTYLGCTFSFFTVAPAA